MKFFATFLILVSFQAGFAQEARLQLNQANQLYRDAQYQKAAPLYEQVLKNGFESTALYYNLGNCYFKMENIPAAILSYERARRLSPRDDDVSYNLRLANLRVVDKIEPLPQLFFIDWWNGFLGLLSSDGWAIAATISLWVASLAGAAFFLFRAAIVQRLAFSLALVSVLACVISGIGLYQQLKWERADRAAIVFSPSVSVKSAPDAQSTDLFVIHEGVKVELTDEVGDWKKVRLADGKIGWLPVEDIQLI